MIIRKSLAEVEQMAKAGEVVAETLALVGEHIKPGVRTEELDALAEEFILSKGGVPTFKGYRGYPASICASPNSMVVHGIPGPYELAEGDVVPASVGREGQVQRRVRRLLGPDVVDDEADAHAVLGAKGEGSIVRPPARWARCSSRARCGIGCPRWPRCSPPG